MSLSLSGGSMLLQTAGDERGFTTCLSATAGALRYRLKNIMTPGKKRTGAILVGLTLFVLAMCSGYVALAYDAQPGTQRLFDGQDLNAVTVTSVDLWNDPRGKDGTCMDEDALKDYLASLQPELYTEKLDEYASGEQRELTVMFDTPQGQLSVRLLDQAVHITRLWGGPDFHTDSYYLRTPTDWAYLDTLIAPVPNLQLIFLNNRVDRVVCRSLTRTAADGTVRVLLASEDWRYNEYLNEDVQEVQLGFSLPLAGPYTVTVEPLRGGARQTLTQDDLPGDCLPLTGPNAKYTVAADLQGEDGAVYHAQYVFIFRKEAS